MTLPTSVSYLLENDPNGLEILAQHMIREVVYGPLHHTTLPTPVTGTTTGAASSNVLINSGASFIVAGVAVGQIVKNITDGSWGIVKSVDSAIQITTTKLVEGSGNDWGTGDSYTIGAAPGQIIALTATDGTSHVGLYQRNTGNTGWNAMAAGNVFTDVLLSKLNGLAAGSTTIITPTGVNDHTLINSTIATVSAAGGGEIAMAAGNFDIGGQVVLYSNIRLRGMGKGVTKWIFNYNIGSGQNGIVNQNFGTTGNFYVELCNFTISRTTLLTNKITLAKLQNRSPVVDATTQVTPSYYIHDIEIINQYGSGLAAVNCVSPQFKNITGTGIDNTVTNNGANMINCVTCYDPVAESIYGTKWGDNTVIFTNCQKGFAMDIVGLENYVGAFNIYNTSSSTPSEYTQAVDILADGCTFDGIRIETDNGGVNRYHNLRNLVSKNCGRNGMGIFGQPQNDDGIKGITVAGLKVVGNTGIGLSIDAGGGNSAYQYKDFHFSGIESLNNGTNAIYAKDVRNSYFDILGDNHSANTSILLDECFENEFRISVYRGTSGITARGSKNNRFNGVIDTMSTGDGINFQNHSGAKQMAYGTKLAAFVRGENVTFKTAGVASGTAYVLYEDIASSTTGVLVLRTVTGSPLSGDTVHRTSDNTQLATMSGSLQANAFCTGSRGNALKIRNTVGYGINEDGNSDNNQFRNIEFGLNTAGKYDLIGANSTIDIPSNVEVYLGSDQLNFVDATYTKVAWDTVVTDTKIEFDAVTNRRFTAAQKGCFYISARVRWTSVITAKQYSLALYKNGSINIGPTQLHAGLAGDLIMEFNTFVNLVKGDYLEIFARSSAGANTVDITSGASTTRLSIHELTQDNF